MPGVTPLGYPCHPSHYASAVCHWLPESGWTDDLVLTTVSQGRRSQMRPLDPIPLGSFSGRDFLTIRRQRWACPDPRANGTKGHTPSTVPAPSIPAPDVRYPPSDDRRQKWYSSHLLIRNSIQYATVLHWLAVLPPDEPGLHVRLLWSHV